MGPVKDAKTRAQARALYEAGQSLRFIANELDANFQTVQNWSKKDGWIKGKAQSKLEQREADAMERGAERAGLTKAKVAAKVIALMDAKKTVFHQGIPMAETTDNGTQVAATSLAADILGMKKVQVDPSDEFRAFFGSLRAK